METKTVQIVHFTVDPDGLTRLVRDMWAKGNYKKALNILGAAKHGDPLAIDVQHDIIRGKMKFALYRNQKDSFCIKADRWKPRGFSNYPDPDEIPVMAAKVAKLESDLEFYKRPVEDDPDEQYQRKVLGEPIPKNRATLVMKKFAGYASLEEMNMALMIQRSIPTVEEYLANAASRDEREAAGKPKPDRSLTADMGWVVPDGKFYACLTKQEHSWLCAQFGLEESTAEELGWVKITKDLMGQTFIHEGKKDATQKQINTVFDWCQKHKQKLPEWAGGRD